MSQRPDPGFDRDVPAFLAALGLLASVALEGVHVKAYVAPSAKSFCTVGAQLDCTTVALSKLSVVLGVPLPIWGIAGFLAMILAAWRRSSLLVPLSGLASVASLLLLVAELTTIRSVCLLCEAVHVLSWLIFAIAWRGRRHLGRADARELAKTLAVPVLGVVGAFFLAPPYWQQFSWRRGVHLPHGVDSTGQEWIGAANPRVTVHEYVDYTCPHCAVSASRMRRLLAEHPSTLRVVRHHFSGMRCRKLQHLQLCQPQRVALCAAEQGRFWEMDSWLFEHAPGKPTVDLAQGARETGIDGSKLADCVTRPDHFDRINAETKAATDAGIKSAPKYVVDGTTYAGADVFEPVRKRL